MVYGFNLPSGPSYFYSNQGGSKGSDNRYSGSESPLVKQKTNSAEEKIMEDKVGEQIKSIRNSAENCKILYVEQLPSHLANSGTVKLILENQFGKVDKVKMLRKQPTTALVQMESAEDAKRAVLDQEKIAKIDPAASSIFIKFCTNIKEVRLGREDELNNNDFARKGGMMNSMMSMNQYGSSRMGRNNNGFQGFSPFAHPIDRYNEQVNMMLPNMYGSQEGTGCCLFVSRLPEDISTPDGICNLLGVYGDVYKVQMIKNNSALVEMATPQQASNAKSYLNQTKIGENKMIVNYSNKPGIRKMSENKETFKDYTRAGIHRFQGLKPGHKMLKSFHRPAAELFVSRFESGKSENVKKYFEQSGYTVKEVKEIGQKGDMAIVTLGSVEEGVKALAKLHNTMPEELGEKKGRRGLTLNFAMSSNRKGGKFNNASESKTNSDTNENSKPDANEEQTAKTEEGEKMED